MENELVNAISINTTIIASVVSIAAVSICSVLSAFITQRGARKAKQAELILQETISAYYELLKVGGEFSDAFNQPQVTRFMDAYTKALLSAIPEAKTTQKKERIILNGDIPSPADPPAGCRFCTRCPFAQDRCRTERPELAEIRPGHFAACFLAGKGGS